MIPRRRFDVYNTRKLQYLAQFGASIDKVGARVADLRRIQGRGQQRPDGTTVVPVDYHTQTYRLFASHQSRPCLQTLQHDVRNFLVPEGCIDLDISNAMPSILYQAFLRHGVQANNLINLAAFNQDPVARCREVNPAHPKKAKGALFLFDGEINSAHTWVSNLKAEIRDAYMHVMGLPAFAGMRAEAEAAATANERDGETGEPSRQRARRQVSSEQHSRNVMGAFGARFYFYYETEILRAIEEEGVRAGYWDNNVSLIFDGLCCVPKPGVIPDTGMLCEAAFAATGFRLELKRKPMVSALTDVVSLDEIPDQLIITEGDKEAAALVALVVANDMCVCEDRPFMKIHGVWTDKSDVVKQHLIHKILQLGIKQLKETSSGEKIELYSHYSKNATQIAPRVPNFLTIRNNFAKELVLSSERKLAFDDGYWEFTSDAFNGVYGRFMAGGSFDTGVKIDRQFPSRVQSDIDFVMSKIINPPFTNMSPEVQQCFLQALGRSLAGHLDKVTNIMVGPRDSSKSMLLNFVENAIGKYACRVPSAVFAIHSMSTDAYREGSWALDMEHARVAVVSESTQTSVGETVFSGDTLKKFQSCKEGMQARRLRENQRLVCSLASGWMLLNDIPRFDPADAIQHCHIYSLINRFVSKEEKTANPFNATLLEANPAVHEWIAEPKYQAALLWIIFEAYRPMPVVPTAEMREHQEQLLQEVGREFYERMFEFTLDETDKIPQADVLKIVKKELANINHPRIRRELQDIIDDLCREENKTTFKVECFIGSGIAKGRKKAYRGIKIRPDIVERRNQHDDDYGAYANGFRP